MKNRKMVAIIAALIMLLPSMSGCGRGKLYEESAAKGYENETYIKGVTFDVLDTISTQAIPVTEISPQIDYGKDMYIYTHEKSVYEVYQIESIVLVVDNTTTYNLRDAKNKEETLKSKDLNNIWMASDDKKLRFDEMEKKDVYKFIGEVSADVSITPEIYGTFAGNFAFIQRGDYECSLFVGAPGQKYDNLSDAQKEIIRHISRSLTISSDEAVQSLMSESEKIIADKSETNHKIEIEKIYSNSEELTSETIETEEKVNHKIREKSQTEKSVPPKFIYTEIGQPAAVQTIDNIGEIKTQNITLVNVAKGETSVDMIKSYASIPGCTFSYEDAPEGYQWVIAEYCSDIDPTENMYVDIKLENLNGENLLDSNNAVVPKRTYDIFINKVKTESGTEKLYCFYLLPDSISEYMLEYGIRQEANGIYTSVCYKIQNQ